MAFKRWLLDKSSFRVQYFKSMFDTQLSNDLWNRYMTYGGAEKKMVVVEMRMLRWMSGMTERVNKNEIR